MPLPRRATLLALASALLFSAAAPAGRVLLKDLPPLTLAGLLYLGAALGVMPAVLRGRGRIARGDGAGHDTRASWRHLAGAIVAGGIVAPVLLLLALEREGASVVSLWLNLELAATALLGIAFFSEHLHRQGWFGVGGAVAAGALLAAGGGWPGLSAGMLLAGACLCWGLDNQWTALVDGLSPAQSTLFKGLVAGGVNLALGFAIEPSLLAPYPLLAALVVGALCYGASIALHIAASQDLGATRAQAIFASAPFFGAALSVAALGEPFGLREAAAAVAFALSVALVLRDRHGHFHAHATIEHTHSHRHDDGHHLHIHPGAGPWLRHSHWHRHAPFAHAHPHRPDLHHRHDH
ncbi:MAG TPA: EamA family transporter [Deltaproteobacteria bacterium]|jgi:drug/metabolite transporter (DMT)-like permease|nr:EamA family transporter [Deltaproteobacteria bacterium]